MSELKPGPNRLPIVVLISGSGSNLQSIIDATQDPQFPVEIKAVISNQATAYGLERAQQAGIKTHVIQHGDFSDRATFDTELQNTIDGYLDADKPGLVVLAGFMRILTDDFVNHYLGRMLNIHPSLLPKFQGLHTHQRAIDAGEKAHGASVHFVTPELDGGPIILQAHVPVLEGDTADELAKRVLSYEHQIYPQVIHWYATKRLSLQKDKVVFDGQALQEPLQHL